MWCVQDGQTALHVSSRLGDDVTALLLLQHSADVDALMRDKHTPLHIAVKHQHLDVINVLLAHSANTHLTSQVTVDSTLHALSHIKVGIKSLNVTSKLTVLAVLSTSPPVRLCLFLILDGE